MVVVSRRVRVLYSAMVAGCLFCSAVSAAFPKFEYHQIAKIGNKMGQTSLVDGLFLRDRSITSDKESGSELSIF